jgi:C-terminal peptidase prc
MRDRAAWSLALLTAAAVACAAPVPPPGSTKPAPSQDRAIHNEADAYARTLADAILKIEILYVRPVSRTDLVEAALAGLYEAAGEPTPSTLRADVKEAADRDILGLLYRTRMSLAGAESLRGQKAILASVEALPRVLDPHCGYANRRDFRWLEVPDNMPNTGLEFSGMPLSPQQGRIPGVNQEGPNSNIVHIAEQPVPPGPLRIQSIQTGSPAQRAGLRPGDLVTRINGHPPESAEFLASFQQLRPLQPGTSGDRSDSAVKLTVLRSGRPDPLTTTVGISVYRPESVFGARRKIDGSWDYLFDPKERIGYVRIGGIRRGYREMFPEDKSLYGTHREFRDALQSLDGSEARGLVLDLRWCPGGYLREATTIAMLLLKPDQNPIARQQDRSGNRESVPFEPLDHPSPSYPIVVLVNGETSGGGELIAAALQDYGRAVIAGQRTVGKASVQESDQLPVPFRLTTRTFLRPTGKNLQRFPDSKWSDDWGVRPDDGRELPLTAEAGRRLKDWYTTQTLRPNGDAEALPLDDPENDPQRQAAVQMLRELIKK